MRPRRRRRCAATDNQIIQSRSAGGGEVVCSGSNGSEGGGRLARADRTGGCVSRGSLTLNFGTVAAIVGNGTPDLLTGGFIFFYIAVEIGDGSAVRAEEYGIVLFDDGSYALVVPDVGAWCYKQALAGLWVPQSAREEEKNNRPGIIREKDEGASYSNRKQTYRALRGV